MSPAKAFLKKKLEARAASANGVAGMNKGWNRSQESFAVSEPVLGLPPDPQADLEEAVREIREEMEARQRKGSKTSETVPSPEQKDM